ncbi:MAG: sigma-70 family RNA polymerase sigma factor [Zavarzinella sp.]
MVDKLDSEHDFLQKNVHLAVQGDAGALNSLLTHYHDRLWRMIVVRLDARLKGRLDADDVIQEAFLEIAQRIREFKEDVHFYIWIRFITLQRLQMLHRHHLGAQMRDARMEQQPKAHMAGTESMADIFLGHLTSPSQAVIRRELTAQLHQILAEMEPLDREVLALRHFEELSNVETAAVLEISPDAASKRHLRALKKLKDVFRRIQDESQSG